ncbi:helix-turn-helix domain-containing protein [Tardiphaga sp. vice352]|uniref:helix-turn-helix domain-containing protein n=1 Tax=Tardiphaga sp. vice352 TaxID=2592816 RepID=UPI0011626AE4|nr:helix-turn-helix domain-containing protein [Tardiphaga sp. vice352]QDM32080.1 helix-turn-helix domain-containing protein [Tardiphaga sp. vice352]
MSGPRYSIIPAGAVTDDTLEPRDLQVLCLLGRHTNDLGWCRRSQVKMAREIKCGRATLQRSLERLYESGWVQKRRREPSADEESQPSMSFDYRVMLDRDDEIAFVDDKESVSESGEGGAHQRAPLPTSGHPGAHPERAPRAHTYVGTKNVPLQRPHLEPERDAGAGARDGVARFIVDFETRWPTSAADDRQRTAYAAAALSDDERKAALDGIGAFLADLKRLKRAHVPAGWTYLEQKRWTLLATKAEAEKPVSSTYGPDTPEAKAITALHRIAGSTDFLRSVMRAPDGTVRHLKPITPRLVALAQAMPREDWVELDRQQAGAWEAFVEENLTLATRRRLSEGALAPWPWPPNKDGGIYTAESAATHSEESNHA